MGTRKDRSKKGGTGTARSFWVIRHGAGWEAAPWYQRAPSGRGFVGHYWVAKPERATLFDTREQAEAEAFLLVLYDPQYIGHLSVMRVRCIVTGEYPGYTYVQT